MPHHPPSAHSSGQPPAPPQTEIVAIATRLLDRATTAAAPLFSVRGAYQRLMDWAMRDEAFKTRLFRFIDVLPALETNAEIVRHLQEYLGEAADELSPLMRGGLAMSGLAAPVLGPAVRANITSLARQFIAGATPDELIASVRALHRRDIAATVDLLGELVITEAEASHYLRRNLEILDAMSAAVPTFGAPCRSDLGADGPLPRVNLSVKISALHAHLNIADPDAALHVLTERMQTILRRAAALGAFVNFDMEDHALKDLTLRLFMRLRGSAEFAEKPAMGIAIQAYLRDGPDDLDRLLAWAREHRRRFTVRLVKGAYWDFETIRAAQHGWPCPVWARKAETDAAYERMTRRLLAEAGLIDAAFGTHNIRTIAHAIACAKTLDLDPRAIEFQLLRGMADPVKDALVAEGWRVREYCPCGELLPGMAYLVRRLLENTSNEGFMKKTFVDHADRNALLADPAAVAAAPPPQAEARPRHRAATFANEPVLDFSRPIEREEFAAAVARARRTPTVEILPVIAGRPVAASAFLDSVNPADPSQIVGRMGCADVDMADRAVEAAARGLEAWAALDAAERAHIIETAAEILRERRFELAALEVIEAGKPWPEADADITEAIDFCTYYARLMRRLGGDHPNERVPGEDSISHYRPRGVAAVIAPWNFPLAILCGMTTAALVTGNTVVMKPAEQTPAIALRLFEILLEAGVPAAALQFLPGRGEEVGARLVALPRVAVIAFTGSREVGLAIWETAGRTGAGQSGLKKVICEMGGKNALIIDDDADLDEAIPGALYSAFSFAGQKCSALSRLIVLESIHDRVVERLIGAAEGLVVDAPEHPGADLGPVIDSEARSRLLAAIERGRRDACLRWQGRVPGGNGFWVPPTIFTDVPRDSTLARDELFGPVLAVFKARSFEDAIALANDSDYALTAGLYSRSPGRIAVARRRLEAGNVYINRPITGAIVGRHPFGGYRLSGGGTKAGGPDYLREFMVPRTVVENTLRRGFAPPPEASET